MEQKIFKAIDKETNGTIDIENAKNGGWYYKCIKCGCDMGARKGKYMSHHFYHRAGSFQCKKCGGYTTGHHKSD